MKTIKEVDPAQAYCEGMLWAAFGVRIFCDNVVNGANRLGKENANFSRSLFLHIERMELCDNESECFMEERNISVKAVMDKDLRGILVQTGQYEEFLSGNLICANCGRVINEDNVSTLLPYEDDGLIKLKFYCNNIGCVNCDK